jgi:Ser/Thr protein kinase RdoA (MazF antagonist)
MVLACYPASIQPLSAPEALGNAGGASGARLWRFATGRGLLVARAWPADGPRRADVDQIHRWLIAAADLGFVPVPLEGLDGQTCREHGGRLWEITPWLSGAPDRDQPPSRSRLRAAFAALGAFHQRLAGDAVRGLSRGLQSRLRETDGLLWGGFDSLIAILDRAPPEPALDPARRWLERARPLAPRLLELLRSVSARELILQPCLRDARAEHWLFEEDRVTGLVDFGAMGLECVAADLARLISEWGLIDVRLRSEALDAYRAVRPLEESEIALIEVFEVSAAILGPGRWVRWRFVEDRTFDDPSAVAKGIERGLERLARLATAAQGDDSVRSLWASF